MVPPMAPADRAPTAHLIRFPAAAATGLASARMAAAGMSRPPWPCPRRNSSSPRRRASPARRTASSTLMSANTAVSV